MTPAHDRSPQTTTLTSILALGLVATIGGAGIASVMWLANPALAQTADKRSQGLDPNAEHNSANIRTSEGGMNHHLRPSETSKQRRGYRLVVVAPQGVEKNFVQNEDNEEGIPPSPGTEETSVVDREALLSTNRDELSPRVDTAMSTSAPAAELFSMTKKRTFDGPRLDFEQMAEGKYFPPPGNNDEGKEDDCDRWAVLTTSSRGAGPTEAMKQLASMKDWCVVVVSDKDGEWPFLRLY